MGFPPEGGEKGMPSSIPPSYVPGLPSVEIFISMVSTALPLSTHNFLANTGIERCLVEGDSTSAKKAVCDGRRYLPSRI